MNKGSSEASRNLGSKSEMDTLKPPKIGVQHKSHSVNGSQGISFMPEISLINVRLS